MSKEKIAQLLLTLPPLKAGEVLRNLDEHSILKSGQAVLDDLNNKIPSTSTASPPHATSEKIFIKETETPQPAEKVVKALYTIAFGEKKADTLFKKLIKKQVVDSFDFLNLYNEDILITTFKDESPLILGVILGYMQSKKAAKILSFFKPQKRAHIIMQMAQHKYPNTIALQAIIQTLKHKITEVIKEKEHLESPGGVTRLTEILSQLPIEQQDTLLSHIKDNTLKNNVSKHLISWKMLLSLSSHDIHTIIKKCPIKELAMLVFTDGVVAHQIITKGLSAHNNDILTEEIQLCKNHTHVIHKHTLEILRNDIFKNARKIMSYNTKLVT